MTTIKTAALEYVFDQQRRKPHQDGRDLYDKLSTISNMGGARSLEVSGFIYGLLSDHRTLQQQSVAILLRTLVAFVEYTEKVGTDARDEAALAKARKAVDAIDRDWRLPTI